MNEKMNSRRFTLELLDDDPDQSVTMISFRQVTYYCQPVCLTGGEIRDLARLLGLWNQNRNEIKTECFNCDLCPEDEGDKDGAHLTIIRLHKVQYANIPPFILTVPEVVELKALLESWIESLQKIQEPAP